MKNDSMNHNMFNIQEAEEMLLNLADNMAAAATSFNSHGYSIFIDARQIYKDTLHDVLLHILTTNTIV